MLIELSYQPNSADLFRKIAERPWAVFLDSGSPFSQRGRYDIITASPFITLQTNGDKTEISLKNSSFYSEADPFLLVKQYLTSCVNSQNIPLPFTGGAIGFFGYDLARRIETLPAIAEKDITMPEMAIGIYDWALVVDHTLKKTLLIQNNNSPDTADICKEVLMLIQQPANHVNESVKLLSDFISNVTSESYANAFYKIQDYLRSGDCYQVNLAQRFHADITGSPWQIYEYIRQFNPAPFSAFLNTPTTQILSLSPERFLQVNNGNVETKPIKGTRPRNSAPDEDQRLANELLNSEKDLAENLMIVDLMRNDLSKNCKPGTVKVPKLFALESYPAVHHLVSTVIGKLNSNKHSLDLLRDCFPGGSITGTPKIRAMEIIEELEPHRRNIYCGSIGYIDYNGNMDTNIAIRTLIYSQQKLYCYAGGAITIDSELAAEYAETYAKVNIILDKLRGLK